MTTRAAFGSVIVFALAAAPLAGQAAEPHAKPTVQNAAFTLFKQLAGDWAGKELGKEDEEIHVRYKVTSGGTAVVETIFPGTDHEMVSVVHPDGPDVLLTHYCMLGNQPQMKASGTADGKTIEFKFVRATNLKSDKDMYMHDATFTLVDSDTLRSEWTHYHDGRASGQVVFVLRRQK
jgi:hypothetical protein